MPLVSLTALKSTPASVVDGLLDAVHNALTASGVPSADRFQRVLRLEPGDLRSDATYPDLKRPRSERFVVVEIALSVGRTLKLKRLIAESIAGAAGALGISPEDVMILFDETRWENWSFAGGRLFHG